jgi:hypothetical protein
MSEASAIPYTRCDPFQMPKCLARPLARGWLTEQQAAEILLLTASRHRVMADDVGQTFRFLWWLLVEHRKREDYRIAAARSAIWRAVRPLIQDRRPINRVLAEAHDANGSYDFPLTEAEVSRLVDQIILWCARQAREAANG